MSSRRSRSRPRPGLGEHRGNTADAINAPVAPNAPTRAEHAAGMRAYQPVPEADAPEHVVRRNTACTPEVFERVIRDDNTKDLAI